MIKLIQHSHVERTNELFISAGYFKDQFVRRARKSRFADDLERKHELSISGNRRRSWADFYVVHNWPVNNGVNIGRAVTAIVDDDLLV